jgi:hypothetical protein
MAITHVAVVQIHLGEGVTPRGLELHRVDHVLGGVAKIVLQVAARRLQVERSPGAREVHDVVVIVGGYWLPSTVLLLRAVHVEHPKSDGEELHDLTGEVLVGVRAGRYVALIAEVGEVPRHHGREGHLTQEGVEVAQRVAHQDVVVSQVRLGNGGKTNATLAYDDDLHQAPCDALAQLICTRCGDLQPGGPG